MDSFNQLQIWSAYQDVLHHSAKNISENQDALITKIAPAMMEAHKNMQTVLQIGQDMAHLEAHLKHVDALRAQTQQALDQLAYIISYLDQIEALIPATPSPNQTPPPKADAAPSQPNASP